MSFKNSITESGRTAVGLHTIWPSWYASFDRHHSTLLEEDVLPAWHKHVRCLLYMDRPIRVTITFTLDKRTVNLILNHSFLSSFNFYVVIRQCFFRGTKVKEGIWGLETHYRNLYGMHIHIKYTNKQNLGRKGVGMAFPRVPTKRIFDAFDRESFPHLIPYPQVVSQWHWIQENSALFNQSINQSIDQSISQ